jgi:hypothetical protein
MSSGFSLFHFLSLSLSLPLKASFRLLSRVLVREKRFGGEGKDIFEKIIVLVLGGFWLRAQSFAF